LATSLFSIAISIIFFFFANEISLMVFHNLECGKYIRILSPLILFMYPDNIIDSMLKGLNKQFEVMICNILDLILTIVILYFLLPVLGLPGYLLAIIISEVFNFCVSYFQLYKATDFRMPIAITCLYIFFAIVSIYEIKVIL
jgi:O-antigen/teichoic acid export membrane protein